MTVSVWPLNIEHLCDTAEMLQLPRGIAACRFSAAPENKVLAGPRWPEGANTEILRDRSRELYGTTLDIVPRHAQFIGVLVEPMNQIEQSLAQHLIFDLLSSTHHIERRNLIVGGYGVEQFAHAS